MVCSQNRHFPTTDLRLAVSSTAGILSKQIEPWCPMWYSWVVQQSTRSMGAPGIPLRPDLTLRAPRPGCGARRGPSAPCTRCARAIYTSVSQARWAIHDRVGEREPRRGARAEQFPGGSSG